MSNGYRKEARKENKPTPKVLTTKELDDDTAHINAQIKNNEANKTRLVPGKLTEWEDSLTAREAAVTKKGSLLEQWWDMLKGDKKELELAQERLITTSSEVNKQAAAVSIREANLERNLETRAAELAVSAKEVKVREENVTAREQLSQKRECEFETIALHWNSSAASFQERLAKLVQDLRNIKQVALANWAAGLANELPQMMNWRNWK